MHYFLSIFFGTFALEDAALASSLALLGSHRLSWEAAFCACFLGISIGDLGLYALGYAATLWGLPTSLHFLKKKVETFSAPSNYRLFTSTIMISRFVPGTRLPCYFSAGYFRYPFLHFVFWTIVSVFAWVSLAFLTGQSLHAIIGINWIMDLVVAFALLVILKWTISMLLNPWQRKAFIPSLRKWRYFEFWPATLFYLPIVPYYIYLSLRHRSFLLPFYANPGVLHGGLIGESKYDFLKHLKIGEAYTLRTKLLKENVTPEILDWPFPFILKPDVGQRGYGVRIIQSHVELAEYLKASNGAKILAQELSTLPREAGIFYIRKPSAETGLIFSITDKQFPFIQADGEHSLGDLILQNSRARMIANTYFARHQAQLEKVFPKGELIRLSECGNHCQGAIFLNGSHLNSAALLAKIDSIAKSIPDFYFGRFDVKYQDEPSLRAGNNFQIVEINGAGSEATHIWDAKTKLLDAYRVLFTQWAILFDIGAEIKSQNRPDQRIQIWSFLKESYKVFRRKDSLSISS